MKSTKKTQNRAESQSINFKAVFSGAAQVTPVRFNPTAEELREIKNIKEEFEVKDPNYTRTIKGEDFAVVSLLAKFNPNKEMKLTKNAYSENVFVHYDILCQNKAVVGAKSGKTQIIDEHNQSAWIKLEGKATLAKQIEKVQEEKDFNKYKDKDGIYKINSKTARIAKVGEVALYQLIFDMSTLDEHRPNTENPEKGSSLDEFKLGDDPTKTFENICNGDVSALNMLLIDSKDQYEAREYFMKGDEQNTIGVILGVRESNEKMYQDVLSPSPFMPRRCTWRATDRMQQYQFGEARVSKETVEQLLDENYPWTSYWSNDLDFREVTSLPKVEVQTVVTKKNDDLPF